MPNPDLVLAALGDNAQNSALLDERFAVYRADVESSNLALTEQVAGLASQLSGVTNERDTALAEFTRLAPFEAQLENARVTINNMGAEIDSLRAQVAAALAALNPQ